MPCIENNIGWEASTVSYCRNVTFIKCKRYCFYRFWEFSRKLHFGQNYTRNIFYSIYWQVILLKFCVVGYSTNAEHWMFLFTEFALRKKDWFAFKQDDCHLIVCSVSSVCILISTLNKYRNFSYLDICRYFGFVGTNSAVRLVFIISSSQPMLSFESVRNITSIYLCKCLNAVSYNIDVFSVTVKNNFSFPFLIEAEVIY